MIIEDEEALASVLFSKFKKEGYNVSLAPDGEAGLDKINTLKPDLILLDIVMPKMNGYEVLEELHKQGSRTPVIIISNSGQNVELEKTKKLGAVDYIIKTQIDPANVIEKVKKYINGAGDGAQVQPEEAKEEIISGPIVLLVEDDSSLRDICFKKLKKEGFNVIAVADGDEVVKLTEEHKPEIILLDIILPSIDGFEVLKQIRSHKVKAIKNVPVIMLTNLGQEEDIKKAMKLGANDYLVKAHFTVEEIVGKVRAILGIK